MLIHLKKMILRLLKIGVNRILNPILQSLLQTNKNPWRKRQLDVFIISTNLYLEKYLLKKATEHKTVESNYDKLSGSYNKKASKKTSTLKWCVLQNKPQIVDTSLAYEEMLKERGTIFNALNAKTVFEVGCGEFTSLMPVISSINPHQYGGLDLSLNRLLAGCSHFEDKLKDNPLFIKANAEHIPLADKSIDLVFTSHCLEWMPEQSRKNAISEIMRVSARYVVFTEPAYKTAHWLQRYRNNAYGYIRDLPEQLAKFSEFEVVSNPVLLNHMNPFNRTEAFVLKRKQAFEPIANMQQAIACPNCKSTIKYINQNTFCDTCNLVFYSFNDIPILDIDYAHFVSTDFLQSRV